MNLSIGNKPNKAVGARKIDVPALVLFQLNIIASVPCLLPPSIYKNKISKKSIIGIYIN